MSREETRVDSPNFSNKEECWRYIRDNYAGDGNKMMIRLRGMGFDVKVAPVRYGKRWYVNIIYTK